MPRNTTRAKAAASKSVSTLSKLRIATKKFVKQTNRDLMPVYKNGWAMLGIVAIIIIAQATLLDRPIVGIYFNAAALAALVALALWKEKIRQLAISVAIIPVSTMIVLSLPQTTTFAREVVFYDSILILGLIYRFMFTLDYPIGFTKLTLKGYALTLPLMAVAGEILGVIGYVMLRHQYIFNKTSLPLVAATVVVFALAEETLFRGLIQQRAAQVMHPMTAAILSTILFTFTSISTTTYLAPLFSLILGATLAYTYAKKQNLVLTFTINALTKLTYIGLMAGFVFR